MRRAVVQLLQQASSCNTSQAAAAAAVPQLVRQFAAPPDHGHPETPLSKVLPGVVALPRQVVSTALNLTGKVVHGLGTSGSAKSLVAQFADKVVLSETVLDLKDVDVCYWAYWLSAAGYDNHAGLRKLAEAALHKVSALEPSQVTQLVVGLHKAGYYDKALFDAIAAHVSSTFTQFETEQLLQLLEAFSEFNHYSTDLFDDIADSITYANHYLAAVKVPTPLVAKGLAAFAKFKHERADLFLTLARGISEVGLGKLTASERHNTVLAALRAFGAFHFYPEQVEALLYYPYAEPNEYSADELKEVDNFKAAVEAQAGGKLDVYKPGHEDAAHWYGHHLHGPQTYDLWVFRESLVPSAYSPATLRPRA